MVLRPSVVPGFQIAADWYDIRIRNAISLASATDIAELWVDQPFRPKDTVTFSPSWTIDALTVAYNVRWQHDLQLGLTVDRRFSFYVGARVLLDASVA